jgi:hypothetical protein
MFSERSLRFGAGEWTAERVRAVGVRLYRATASTQYVLDEGDRRVPVSP